MLYVIVMQIQNLVFEFKDPVCLSIKMNEYSAFWFSHLFAFFITIMLTYLLRKTIWNRISSENFNSKRMFITLLSLMCLLTITTFISHKIGEIYLDRITKSNPNIHSIEFYEFAGLWGYIIACIKVIVVVFIVLGKNKTVANID
ncbi:MAG: hypothetical protein COA38_01995 [Fluviicola sp.]|nr:MAG: hypothetical protein COA38_01995 [Fluviicola sp.]